MTAFAQKLQFGLSAENVNTVRVCNQIRRSEVDKQDLQESPSLLSDLIYCCFHSVCRHPQWHHHQLQRAEGVPGKSERNLQL